MQRIRLPVAVLVIWLFLFYNAERLNKHINFTTPAYIMVPVVATIILLVPRLQRIRLIFLLGISVPALILLEAWWDIEMLGAYILLTLAECCALAVTIVLARQVGVGVDEFENAVTNMTIGRGNERRTRQGEIYREVQRARIHQRPLSLVALKADETSAKIAIDRIVQEAQQAMIKQYVLGGVSKSLVEVLPDYNIVARLNDHLLVVLPEVTPEKMPEVVERLRKAVSEQVGVALHIGTAYFPEDATTVEGLLEKAVADMEADRVLEQLPQPSTVELLLGKLPIQEKSHGPDNHQS